MSESVELSHAHQMPVVPTTGDDSVFLLLELNSQESNEVNRSPINLSLVLDRSGSMTGEPLEYCKEASKFVVNQLSNYDIMNLVVFDDEVDTVFHSQNVTNKNVLKNRIDTIETGGITNLSGGLIQGCQNILTQKTKEYVNRVILLSDGVANSGITDAINLQKIAEDYSTAGAVITTMGVGDHFDEELLEGIANAGNGNYHFIDQLETIPNIFEKELDGLLSVVAQNVSLNLTPAPGVKIKNISGYHSKETDEGIEVRLGDSYSKEKKSVLIECSLPSHKQGLADMLHVDWSFMDVTYGVKECKFQRTITIEYTSDLEKLSSQPNPSVEKQIEITKSAKQLEQALHLFDEGDMDGGKKLLYSNALHMESRAVELNDEELLAESEVVLHHVQNFDYSENKRKALHAEKYRRMKRGKRES
ncbi:vWA domain-containing protein [Halobacillus seohaensis]|uniref:VWA domain-containing protein n=1 Tax=Halobacillus seohaensis TaxID=447421 RepID=A0ABW2EIE3_9BACI